VPVLDRSSSRQLLVRRDESSWHKHKEVLLCSVVAARSLSILQRRMSSVVHKMSSGSSLVTGKVLLKARLAASAKVV